MAFAEVENRDHAEANLKRDVLPVGRDRTALRVLGSEPVLGLTLHGA